MTSTLRCALFLTALAPLAACQDLPVDTAADLDSGLGALDEGLLHADELAEVPLEAKDEGGAWSAHYYCTTSGSLDSGWVWSGTSTYDFARTRASWSGSSVDGVGTITVSATLNGFTYTSAPSTLALTGAVKVNGSTCGSVSVVDRDGNYDAKATGSCTMSWNGPASTAISVQDSSAGMRAEFLRSGGTTRFYVPSSGSSATTCWWG